MSIAAPRSPSGRQTSPMSGGKEPRSVCRAFAVDASRLGVGKKPPVIPPRCSFACPAPPARIPASSARARHEHFCAVRAAGRAAAAPAVLLAFIFYLLRRAPMGRMARRRVGMFDRCSPVYSIPCRPSARSALPHSHRRTGTARCASAAGVGRARHSAACAATAPWLFASFFSSRVPCRPPCSRGVRLSACLCRALLPARRRLPFARLLLLLLLYSCCSSSLLQGGAASSSTCTSHLVVIPAISMVLSAAVHLECRRAAAFAACRAGCFHGFSSGPFLHGSAGGRPFHVTRRQHAFSSALLALRHGSRRAPACNLQALSVISFSPRRKRHAHVMLLHHARLLSSWRRAGRVRRPWSTCGRHARHPHVCAGEGGGHAPRARQRARRRAMDDLTTRGRTFARSAVQPPHHPTALVYAPPRRLPSRMTADACIVPRRLPAYCSSSSVLCALYPRALLPPLLFLVRLSPWHAALLYYHHAHTARRARARVTFSRVATTGHLRPARSSRSFSPPFSSWTFLLQEPFLAFPARAHQGARLIKRPSPSTSARLSPVLPAAYLCTLPTTHLYSSTTHAPFAPAHHTSPTSMISTARVAHFHTRTSSAGGAYAAARRGWWRGSSTGPLHAYALRAAHARAACARQRTAFAQRRDGGAAVPGGWA